MTPIIQTPEMPCRVPLAFDEAAARGITGLRWAVAYITAAGSLQLVNRLRQQLKGSWEAAAKVIITSCDYGITEPDAIDYLTGLKNCRVMLASPDVINRPGFRPATAFHPKLYLFDSQAGLTAIVGSANLTVRAFTSNCEAVSLYWSAQPDATWESMWKSLTAVAVEFTPELRAQYRTARAGHSPPIDIDPPVPPEPPVLVALPVFLDEIQAGQLSPVSFENLWVEAGSMTSSRSHNQLELPRGGNLFFGFSFDQYDDIQTDIGVPLLFVFGHPYHDRKLVWHGGTGMERYYLPTENQSGLEYQGQIIVFRRTAAGFDLHVFPWDSAAAVACRTASRQIDRMYQLGAGSPRICGVY